MAPNNDNDNDSDSKVTAEETQAILKKEYQAILNKNGITDEISEVLITIPDLKGQHMGSLIELVELKFENGNPSKHLFVKKLRDIEMGQSEVMADMLKNMVTTEGSFLLEFTEAMKKVCKTNGVENGLDSMLDDLFPQTYHYDARKIVMENLVKRGFATLPKKDKLDFNHSALVLKNLAKFHGVTYVMIQEAGGVSKFLKSYPNYAEKLVIKEVQEAVSATFEPTYGLVLQVLNSSTHPEKDEKYNILTQYQGTLGKLMGDVCGAPSVFEVCNHGDLWSNNIMFEGSGPEYTNLKLVDLQAPRVGSPNLDIGYFLYTSVRIGDRKRWRELLQIYYDEIKKIVQSLGAKFDHSFEEFLEDFKKKSKVGFVFGIVLLMGFEAIGSHDAEENTEKVSFEELFFKLFQKFIAENPDKVMKIAEDMIAMVNDYQDYGEL